MESDSFVLLGEGAILGPHNVSGVQPGTKGKEKEKNESVQAGRMERQQSFDTRSATKRTCCGRITVHISSFSLERSSFFQVAREYAHLRSGFSNDHS